MGARQLSRSAKTSIESEANRSGRFDVSEARDRVASDEANARLTEVRASLASLASAAGSASLPALKRANTVVALAHSQMARSDCDLVTSSMLERLRNELNQLNNFFSNEVARVQQGEELDGSGLQVQLDTVCDALAMWPAFRGAKATGIAAEAVDQVAAQATAALDPIRAEIEELRSSLGQQVQERTDQLEGIRTDADGVSGRLAAVESTLSQQKQNIDNAVGELRAAFDGAQGERQTAFDEQMSATQTSLDELVKGTQSNHEGFLTKARQDADTRLAELDQYVGDTKVELDVQLKSAREVVGAIGRKSQTGGYQEYANAQNRSATFWRWVTVACGVAAAVFAVVFGLSNVSSSDDVWITLLRNAGPAAALAALTVYASRQSAHHREMSVEARRLQLSLTAIGPYLQPLDDAERQRVLERCAYTFFTNPPQHHKGTKTEYQPLPQTAIEAIVEGIVTGLAKQPAD